MNLWLTVEVLSETVTPLYCSVKGLLLTVMNLFRSVVGLYETVDILWQHMALTTLKNYLTINQSLQM